MLQSSAPRLLLGAPPPGSPRTTSALRLPFSLPALFPPSFPSFCHLGEAEDLLPPFYYYYYFLKWFSDLWHPDRTDARSRKNSPKVDFVPIPKASGDAPLVSWWNLGLGSRERWVRLHPGPVAL